MNEPNWQQSALDSSLGMAKAYIPVQGIGSWQKRGACIIWHWLGGFYVILM